MEKFSINGIIQGVVISLILGAASELWKVYMAVHDLQAKVEWLYHYDFPDAAKK